jgi:hypothetical protein
MASDVAYGLFCLERDMLTKMPLLLSKIWNSFFPQAEDARHTL